MDLVGVSEIAEMLGVSRQRVNELSRDRGFPKPAATLVRGRVWRRSQVERWARKVGRLDANGRAVRPRSGPRPRRP